MWRLATLAAGAVLALAVTGAHAAESDLYCYNTGTMPPAFVPCNSANPLQTTGGGGGGGGGPVTAISGAYVDGAIVTLGTKADAAWASGSGTLIAIEKGIYGKLGSPFQAGGSIGNTAFGVTGALPAGTNNIGTTTPEAAALTTAGCTVANSSGTCLAAALVTTHLQIQNVSTGTTNYIACNFGGTAILNNSGSFLLAPGQSANWGGATGVVPTGALNCISTSGSAPLYVEYN